MNEDFTDDKIRECSNTAVGWGSTCYLQSATSVAFLANILFDLSVNLFLVHQVSQTSVC